MYRTHNRVNDILDGGGRLPTVRAQFLCEHVNELCFVHPNPPKPVVLVWNRLVDTVNPYPADFQEPRAISLSQRPVFRNPVAALDRWRGPKMAQVLPAGHAEISPGSTPQGAGRVRGFQYAHVPSKASISSSFRSVRAISSRPSSSRHAEWSSILNGSTTVAAVIIRS
ncbi:Uncharacterised protein [Mycobacterium tuberculosis]|nr:Uncharacterised protein [Mycobacterium tuberculosis]